ncbi:MmcQ/YjbR family DNA-binding protein [Verrucomicrobiales bacterium]|nr:MmcQ/YjbR family DNA-binding protein [Verrucomicrobiales bacterium]
MNDVELLRDFALSLPETAEETPFGPEVAVYKVAGKMFVTLWPDDVPIPMNLKCDPDRAIELRDQHEAVRPGYHMNKKHWNTIELDGSLSDDFLRELIRHSYDLVISGHKREVKERLLKALES